jgi:RimJ/RimL family protein N-acetyltransferase
VFVSPQALARIFFPASGSAEVSASRFEFRELTPDDIPMLNEWLHRPHVAEWWDEQVTDDELRDQYFTPDPGAPGTRYYIAWLDGRPAGFIQSYVPAEEHGDWWPDVDDPGLRGIDQFLADGEGLGKGIGTAMVRDFAGRLFADPAVTRIQTDPHVTNARAIRCYEKAGFRRVGEIATPDGRELLMYLDRPPAASPSVSR